MAAQSTTKEKDSYRKYLSTKVDFENGRFGTWGSTLIVEITSPRVHKGPLRLAEWGNGLQGLKVIEIEEKISTKVDFENGRFGTWGSTLIAEITSPRVHQGPLRLAEWGNGLQGLKVIEIEEKISTKVDFGNGRFGTWGSTLIVEITSPCVHEGQLRLAEWVNGFQGLKVIEIKEKISKKVDFENGGAGTWGSTLIVEITYANLLKSKLRSLPHQRWPLIGPSFNLPSQSSPAPILLTTSPIT